MSRTIHNTLNGPLILSLSDPLSTNGSDSPLTVAANGAIISSGDGIDGDASTMWWITNRGAISAQDNGIVLAGDGILTNSGTIQTASMSSADYVVEIDGNGKIYNTGSIFGPSSNAVKLGSGIVRNSGSIINILGYGILLGTGMIENSGHVLGDVSLGAGSIVNTGHFDSEAGGLVLNSGSVINSGFIQSQSAIAVTLGDNSRFMSSISGFVSGRSGGVRGGNNVSVANAGVLYGGNQAAVSLGDNGVVSNSGTIGGITAITLGTNGHIVNTGLIIAEYDAVTLQSGVLVNHGTVQGGIIIVAGGTLTNSGSITRSIEFQSGSGTLINSGILGALSFQSPSVVFDAGTTNDRLVVDPGASFIGAVLAPNGSNSTIELAAGTASIAGIGTGQFYGFDTVSVDAKASWSLDGTDTIGTILDNGTVAVSGTLDITRAIDAASTGAFHLLDGATLDVAAALGARSVMSFAAPSELIIDDTSLFGTHVGAASYTGPLLENFTAGESIDLKDFSLSDLRTQYTVNTGLLQITNNAQTATLHFQGTSTDLGLFNFTADGTGGLLITHT